MADVINKDKMAVVQVLGSLMKKPSLLLDDKYHLELQDFPEKFHQILYGAIENLIKSGIQSFTYVTIDDYLAKYEKQYKNYSMNKGNDYVAVAMSLADPDNFDYYYNVLKKFSLLNALSAKGFDTKKLYNPDEINPEALAKMQQAIDAMKIEDIVNCYEKDFNEIKEKFHAGGGEGYGIHGAEGIKRLKEELKLAPEFGPNLSSKKLTTICRGARLKKLYMRSSPSGFGKCIVGDSLIYTDKGVIKIEDIPKYYKVGDKDSCVAKIVSYEEKTGKKELMETSHWFNMGISKTIKVTTRMGYEIEGTPEHPIIVSNKNGETSFKRLEDITKEDNIAISINNNLWGENEIPLEVAYSLGVLVGDGYLNRQNVQNNRLEVSYTNRNESIFSFVNETFMKYVGETFTTKKSRDTFCHSSCSPRIFDFVFNKMGLKSGVAKEKIIPEVVMTGTKDVVSSFLQGLFDTDGSVDKRGMFQYSTASKFMSLQVQTLLLNFGILSSRRVKTVKGIDYFIIDILNRDFMRVYKKEIGFKNSTQKKERLENATKDLFHNSNTDFLHGTENLEYLHRFLKDNVEEYFFTRDKKTSYNINGLSFYESMKNGHKISRSRVKAMLDGIDIVLDIKASTIKNKANNIFIDSISSIEFGESVVYDFTVPINHSFVSNGIISHNTRHAVADALTISIPILFNIQTNKWEKTGCQEPTLFITTELEVSEIQTLVMAFISGVPEEVILDGKYTGNQEERVDRAIEILERSPFYIEYMPSFDIEMLEHVIKKHKYSHNIGYVFFDYLFASAKILTEMASKAHGVKMREDNILLLAIDRLKYLANTLNIFVFTATQVNDSYKTTQTADQGVLRGAKALADKVDIGYAALPLSQKDKEMIIPIVHQLGCPEPNICIHVYKARRSKLAKVKLWGYFDYGNLRWFDCFVTNNDYLLLDVDDTNVEIILEENAEIPSALEKVVSEEPDGEWY